MKKNLKKKKNLKYKKNTTIKMDHQNWETYIIHCKDTKKSDTKDKRVKKEVKKKMGDGLKNSQLEKKIEEGDLKHKKIDPELSKKIQQGRLSKGYTQKQLANRLSIPVNEINEMECGKFIYNGQKISKVKRFLSIK
tara:strand:- start:378 stop:785 length:408 start_codon:yes stop_codon:yes gene_type:complete